MKNELFNTYLKKLENHLSILEDKNEETEYNTLKALWMTASGNPVSALKSEECELPDLSDSNIKKLEDLISRRIKGIPLAHLTQRQSFMGMEMLAGSEALIPRKETEILGYTAIKILKNLGPEELCIIDVCTGAGNIALAIANSLINTKIHAADISSDAIKLANKNSIFLDLSSQVTFYSGDLLEPFENIKLHNKANLLTCNPPYISTSKVSEMPDEISSFEPDLAFDGGVFGINLIRRLITDAEKFLCDDGYLVFEVGLGQGNIIKKQVEKSNLYKNIKTVNDNLGNPRVIVAQKNKESL